MLRSLCAILLCACADSSLLRADPRDPGASGGRIGAGLLISEIAHNPDWSRFIEVCNRGSTPQTLQGIELVRYANGSTEPESVELPAIDLRPGEAFVMSGEASGGLPIDWVDPIASGNGNDTFVLRVGDAVLDTYGEIGVDGRDQAWNYHQRGQERSEDVTTGSSTWTASQWNVVEPGNTTPGICSTPAARPEGLVLHEVADVAGTASYKYVSVCNPTSQPVELDGHALGIYVNEHTTPRLVQLASRTLQPFEAHVVVLQQDAEVFAAVHGEADQTWGSLTGNGNDAYGLFRGETRVDLLGIPGRQDGSWDYTDRIARRLPNTPASPEFDAAGWAFGVDEAQPFTCGDAAEAPTEPTPPEVEEPASCAAVTLSGWDLRAHVRSMSAVDCGYSSSRSFMLGELDAVDGIVQCRYTDAWAYASSGPTAGTLNTEHLWPQSQGAGGGTPRCDLNHLLPVDEDANSRRASHPFGEVATITWSRDGSALGTDAWGDIVFEPPADAMGDIARALLYMHATYNFSMDAAYKERMKAWSAEDPVDAAERERSARIAAYQGSGNPLVTCPSWAQRL